ncbi:hypothetical protein Patl1_26723 [Pistacia atlantica]|uniref:Uncharacterized protein n=1 Tax=Pistacia atlantica TaxID=434234 RepID=A0ACC1B3G0_9ROSI|nr:hypothetical protein Patl1_26723 [Pistacia atlantica]
MSGRKIASNFLPSNSRGDSSLITPSQNPFISLWNYKRYHVNLVTKVEKLMDAKERVKHRMKFCPDLITRYHLSNGVVRQLKAVAELREGVIEFHVLKHICLSTLDHPDVNMIGVYGMGGIGQSVLVKQVAARVEKNNLFDVVIFTEVTLIQTSKRFKETLQIIEEEAFSLFKKIAGNSAEIRELQCLAIDIAKAWGGLPLAIASIAIALRGKGVSAWCNAL